MGIKGLTEQASDDRIKELILAQRRKNRSRVFWATVPEVMGPDEFTYAASADDWDVDFSGTEEAGQWQSKD